MRFDRIKILQTRFVQVVIVCMLFCSITPLYAATPWLHVEGNQIKDPAGNVVVLRGIALIDLGFLEDLEGGAIEMIDRLMDRNDSQGDSPGWYPKVIRIMIAPYDAYPGYPSKWTPADDEEYYTNHLRPFIDYCKSRGLYVIIDWHYIGNTYDHVATTSDFWTHMAPRFANDSHVLFELFNEPVNDIFGDWIFNETDVNDWLSVRQDMQTWIDIVRSYAPNNLILVAGAYYSQVIGPVASYPLTGDNIVIVSHIYPSHWLDGWASPLYKNEITTCAAVYPVMMTEWGFTLDPNYDDEWHLLIGAITDYGQPLADFREQYGIGNTAWCASDEWGTPMFERQTDPPPPGTWPLRCGEGEMGCFTKDILYQKRNNDQPTPDFIDFTDFAAQWGRTDCNLSNVWCSSADFYQDGSVLFDDLEAFVDDWLYP
ncbi:MAG: cellulase family glycosylhydrolase [Phycisphaerae bacterium]|nr:cellulase family glycosylhydrolase [Phycisphaerae bacterium]